MAHPRILRAFAALSLALAGIATPVTAEAAPVSAADVDDFSYASWDADYEVGLDGEGRALMRVTETLVARFPETDQNRGIVRGLPTSYQGASTETRIIAVTDEDGTAVPYETDEEDGLTFVSIGTDDYVQGLTTYVIEYEMRDMVLATSPTGGRRRRRWTSSIGTCSPSTAHSPLNASVPTSRSTARCRRRSPAPPAATPALRARGTSAASKARPPTVAPRHSRSSPRSSPPAMG
ncbi:DUF2207 domain-containing protein [Microbacterium aurugineum]